ncbi:BlaI/MecI/CopY family transcriptional regulator [Terricaulis sp.]|uniref:BlaI/MecI/CopY family transcriptional regulator n=1 Tax=Terricaulis sp. TaxID=2768686 RepID=UPI002AC3D46F|nr:BlaI/MecI/CopY family transcriptional regulator [Terricaulis sp.]MDZ4692223.1 BlaI/MecI/CopY family transcriptional regulator [Terricaulis sp.]
MAQPPRPSGSELKLLRALWSAERLSAREIQDATASSTKWSYSATRTTLDRMEEKGLLNVALVHGIKTYAAAHSKLAVLALLAQDFARNVLDSDTPLPAAAFANSKLLDADEIEDLQLLLDSLSDEGEDQ